MNGTITKKDVLKVLRYFGVRKALKLLVSRRLVALNLLMA